MKQDLSVHGSTGPPALTRRCYTCEGQPTRASSADSHPHLWLYTVASPLEGLCHCRRMVVRASWSRCHRHAADIPTSTFTVTACRACGLDVISWNCGRRIGHAYRLVERPDQNRRNPQAFRGYDQNPLNVPARRSEQVERVLTHVEAVLRVTDATQRLFVVQTAYPT